MNRLSGLCIILPLCVMVTGWAGLRGGWESAAYIDGTAPAAPQRQRSAERPELNIPGLNLHVDIDNRLQTYDRQIFFGVPLFADPTNLHPKNNRPGKTRVFVGVTR